MENERKNNIKTTDLLRVSSKSKPSSVAGSITANIKETGFVEIQAIGAGAVNQTVKAIAIARGFLSPVGIELMCIPVFLDVNINGEKKSGIKFAVKGINIK